MAAPFYSQEEADALIAMPKRIEHEAWDKRKTGRPADYQTSVVVVVQPEIDDEGRTEFKIEINNNDLTDALNITLVGRIGKRPFEGLCRYDLHDGVHNNPLWFSPACIEPNTFHRHLYKERAVQEFDLWHKCALPLDLSPDGSPEQLRARLWWRFLEDMKVRFSDSDTFFGLFGATQ